MIEPDIKEITLTIDGKQVTVPAGTTILEAARKVNIDIPTLCFLKEINEGAFYNCNECEYLYLPDSLRIIAKNAFDYCTSLQYIKLGSNLDAIGFDAFRNCYTL